MRNKERLLTRVTVVCNIVGSFMFGSCLAYIFVGERPYGSFIAVSGVVYVLVGYLRRRIYAAIITENLEEMKGYLKENNIQSN